MSVKSRAARERALQMHARVIRSIGRCQACGSPWNLECAHVVTRSRAATATDLGNAFCLCHTCHARFTEHPKDWTDWVIRQIGVKAYDELHYRSLRSVKATEDYWLDQIRLLEERDW